MPLLFPLIAAGLLLSSAIFVSGLILRFNFAANARLVHSSAFYPARQKHS